MRWLRVLLIVLATAGWADWLVLVPFIAASRSGDVAVLASALTYRAGSVICHQQTERSWYVAGVQMPVCARCTGLYAGAPIGAAVMAVWLWRLGAAGRVRPALPLTPLRVAVALSGAPTLALWVAEHLIGMPVSNSLRAAGAALFGAAVAGVVTAWAGGASFEDTPPATAIH
jgi:hypothetical protein